MSSVRNNITLNNIPIYHDTKGECSGIAGFSGEGAEYRFDILNIFPRGTDGKIETFGILEGKDAFQLREDPHKLKYW